MLRARRFVLRSLKRNQGPAMPDHRSSSSEDRVVDFRTRRALQAGARPEGPTSDDLDHYARDAEPDDFRHRMTVNAVAFVFLVGLVLAGVWLADTITTMRKTQDCVLAGKRGCAPVEAPAPAR
jgi:hypothetical protein